MSREITKVIQSHTAATQRSCGTEFRSVILDFFTWGLAHNRTLYTSPWPQVGVGCECYTGESNSNLVITEIAAHLGQYPAPPLLLTQPWIHTHRKKWKNYLRQHTGSNLRHDQLFSNQLICHIHATSLSHITCIMNECLCTAQIHRLKPNPWCDGVRRWRLREAISFKWREWTPPSPGWN